MIEEKEYMDFQTFLKHYLQPQSGSLTLVSQFKMQNPIDYAKYRDRVQRVEEYAMNNAQRSLREGHSEKPLTPENFSEMEKYADAMNKLTGKAPTYKGNTMQDAFNRLTSTQQQDIYYRAMLRGRVNKSTGEAEYMQSDFDWLQSDDYKHVLELRAQNK